MKRLLSAILLLIGILLLCLQRPIIRRAAPFISNLTERVTRAVATQPAILTRWTEKTYAYAHGGGASGLTAHLQLSIRYPKKVLNGSSFLVAATVRILDVTEMSEGDLRKRGLTRPEMMSAIDKSLSHGDVKFLLSIAGAEVQPSLPITATQNTLVWSVHPREPGVLYGVITPSNAGLRRTFEPSLDMDALPLEIVITNNFLAPSTVLSAIVSFFGGLLTLPGILTFLHERRDQLEAKRKQANENEASPGG